MKHFFKAGGDWKLGDFSYTVKCVQEPAYDDYLIGDKWYESLDELMAAEGVKQEVAETEDNGNGSVDQDPDEYKKQLIEQITVLGGSADGRSSVANLEKQLDELNGDSN